MLLHNVEFLLLRVLSFFLSSTPYTIFSLVLGGIEPPYNLCKPELEVYIERFSYSFFIALYLFEHYSFQDHTKIFGCAGN